MNKHRIFRKSRILYAGIAGLTVLLNIAAWNSNAFADWYIAHIFPVWVGTYGRLTGLAPFSVGEWLIVAGLALVGLVLISGVVWIGIAIAAVLRMIVRKCPAFERSRRSAKTSEGCCGFREKEESEGKGGWPGGYRRFSRGLYRFFAWTLLFVCLIMTLNCFILYHASTFSEHYLGEDDNEYTLEELLAVYNMVADECNRLSAVMERDEDGEVLYPGNLRKEESLLELEERSNYW